MVKLVKTVMRGWALVIAAVLLAGCAGVPVNIDYDPEANLLAIKTFTWLPADEQRQKLVVDPLVDNDLYDRRIKRAVTDRLLAQGLTEADDIDQADALINYHISTEEKIDIDTWHANYGYYPCWSCTGPHYGFSNDIWVSQYTQGTLIIDVVDTASRKLIWRGIANRRLPSFKTPQDREAYIKETVTAILLNFPQLQK